MTVAEQLRELIAAERRDLPAIAKRAGVGADTLRRWLQGAKAPTPELLGVVLQVLRVPLGIQATLLEQAEVEQRTARKRSGRRKAVETTAPPDTHFGRVLHQYMLAHQLSRDALASRLGVTGSTVNNWLQVRLAAPPHLAVWVKQSEALKLNKRDRAAFIEAILTDLRERYLGGDA